MRMAIVDDVLAEQEIIKKYIIEWASIHNLMIYWFLILKWGK